MMNLRELDSRDLESKEEAGGRELPLLWARCADTVPGSAGALFKLARLLGAQAAQLHRKKRKSRNR